MPSQQSIPVPAAAPTPWTIPRGLIVLLTVASAAIVIGGMRIFAEILGPVFLALMLTIAVQPIQSRAQNRGRPAWIGMVGALITVYFILIGIAVSLAFSTAQLASLLPEYTEEVDAKLDGLRRTLADNGVDDEQIQNALNSIDMGKLVDVLSSALEGLLGVFSNLFFVLALLMFTTLDGMTIGRKMRIVSRTRPDIAYALATFAQGTRNYLVVSTVFGFIVAVLDGTALWLLGVPLPILWALLSFITNYIPNVGFLIGVIPPALLALLEGGPALMLWVIVIYSVINFVIQSVIQPKFVGDAVGISVTASFLSLVFWAWVLGPLGALLAIPLTQLVKAVLIDIDPATRWIGVLISEKADEDDVPDDGTTGERAASAPAKPPHPPPQK